MCVLCVFVPNTVIAAVGANVDQMEHKQNVPVDKVWKIKFNKEINVDNLTKGVMVYNPIGLQAKVKISYDAINNTIIVQPPASGYIPGQTYSLHVYDTIKDLNDNLLKAPIIKNFTIEVLDNEPVDISNKKYIYKGYDNTLDQIVERQSRVGAVNVLHGYTLDASNIDIYEYLNPKNFKNHDYAIYQFLTLNYIEGITAEDLNMELGGILAGKGEMFLKFCKLYNVNPAYIVAHARLETGIGTSALANGIEVNEVDGKPVEIKTTYNMFGIGAYDRDPNKLGSERAYNEEWFTVEAAVEGGIKFISDKYINNAVYKQNTIYKMRWNPDIQSDTTYRHQYATDISWAYKQSYKIKEILDKYKNAQLVFEIPQYK